MPSNCGHPAGGERVAGSCFYPAQPGYGAGLHLLGRRTVKQDLGELVFDFKTLGEGLRATAILRYKSVTGGVLLRRIERCLKHAGVDCGDVFKVLRRNPAARCARAYLTRRRQSRLSDAGKHARHPGIGDGANSVSRWGCRKGMRSGQQDRSRQTETAP